MDPFVQSNQHYNVVKIYNATKYTFVVVNPECPLLEYSPDFSPLKCCFNWKKDSLASSTVCLPIMNTTYNFSKSSEIWFDILEKNEEREDKTALIVDYDILIKLPVRYRSSLLCPILANENLFSERLQGNVFERVVISGFARVSVSNSN